MAPSLWTTPPNPETPPPQATSPATHVGSDGPFYADVVSNRQRAIESGPGQLSVPERCGMTADDDRVTTFRRMHSSGCFVMPNPWDAGSAKALEQMGFKALATTSAGLAWTLGCADEQVTLDQTWTIFASSWCRRGPVNADFRAGTRSTLRVQGERGVCGGDGDRGFVDRGLDGRRGGSSVRPRAGCRTHSGRTRGDRGERHGCCSHWSFGGFRVRPP